ncbi:MAG: polyphosphate:AMP phosphotransferase [Planctomycetes bacterium]|nr:polyphosphate:AMP phosphotransferase [Planctomycetota bacterium]
MRTERFPESPELPKLGKAEFAAEEIALREQLLLRQRELRAAGARSLLVIVSGVESAGKSEVVNRLNEWLDARGVRTVAFWDESDEERERPRAWRFWRELPPRGSIGIFFGSWYTQPIVERVFRRSSREEFDGELAEIASLERLLAADGTVLVKLWFHLGEKAQERRLERLARHGARALTPWEKRFRSRYRRFVRISTQALDATDASHAPWHVIDAADRRRRDLAVGKILLAALERAVQPQEREPQMAPLAARSAAPARSPILAAVDLSSTREGAELRERLRAARAALDRLSWKAREQRRSTVVVFEGWDAAGKGGAIRRVSSAIDARLCRVIPIAAPTDEERAQHYLWRFWRHVPRAGYVTIFDRSWYGRVLVERVEGLATEAEWARAFDELAHFERELARGGIIVQKFWLHVSADEQLRRFEGRASSAVKQYKIGPEDWRNRARWADYELALQDIFTHTSIPEAPWEIVPANDKRGARVHVLETLVRRLTEAL